MRKYTAFFVFCLVMFLSTTMVFAQQATTEPQGPKERPKVTGQKRITIPQNFPGQSRFTGPWFTGPQRFTDQQRFNGPQRFTGPQRFPGMQRPTGPQAPANQYGFTGPSQVVTTAQVKSFADRTPLIVRGTITHAVGPNRYLFRDSSGEITIRIGAREWRNVGSNIGPTDTVEISGVLRKAEGDEQRAPEIRAISIKKM